MIEPTPLSLLAFAVVTAAFTVLFRYLTDYIVGQWRAGPPKPKEIPLEGNGVCAQCDPLKPECSKRFISALYALWRSVEWKASEWMLHQPGKDCLPLCAAEQWADFADAFTRFNNTDPQARADEACALISALSALIEYVDDRNTPQIRNTFGYAFADSNVWREMLSARAAALMQHGQKCKYAELPAGIALAPPLPKA
jgi:hypothetical protein